jgi:hypothetical protein
MKAAKMSNKSFLFFVIFVRPMQLCLVVRKRNAVATFIVIKDNLLYTSAVELVGMQHAVDGVAMLFAGRNDAFGEDPRQSLKRHLASGITPFKSAFNVRTLAYSDIHAFMLEDLIEILDTYPDFAVEFLRNFTVAFNLKPEVDSPFVCTKCFSLDSLMHLVCKGYLICERFFSTFIETYHSGSGRYVG